MADGGMKLKISHGPVSRFFLFCDNLLNATRCSHFLLNVALPELFHPLPSLTQGQLTEPVLAVVRFLPVPVPLKVTRLRSLKHNSVSQ